ncbi:uncharacterized protein LOC133039848 isoform X3 [Cannabis sativa]|uniref:uncharacterized protein LOC133039848 isoform X3 n=1 Tax=Cannabis sativa TaxID=3483 RepID=UPI0029CA9DEB|nr:uncharacterized protein LOC133039848 isoform X3 [Cannabis sativa]
MRPLKKRIAREFEQADEDSSRARRNEPKARQEPAQQGFFQDKLPLIGRPNAVNNTPMPGQYSQGFFKQMLPENVESYLKNLPPLPKLPIQSQLPPRPPHRPRSRIPRLPPRPPRPPGALPMPYSLRSRPKTQLVPPPWVQYGLPKQILILDEGSTSILIEKLHSTLLSIIGGRLAYARHFYTIVDKGKSPYRNGAELESFEKKESNVNDAMFFNIFYLENCLNYPYYDVNTDIAQLSSSVKCFREKFLQKLGVTSCMISNVKSKFRCVYDYDEQDRERVRKFKDMVKEEIKDIWKNLSLR